MDQIDNGNLLDAASKACREAELSSPSSPSPLPPRAEPLRLLRLPEELCRTPHWVLYTLRWSPGRGKWDKLPRQADFRMASHADPPTWTTFEEALTAFCGDGRFAGLGFVFAEDDSFVGFDLDDARDPVKGEIISPRVEEVIYGLASYTEVTPSGRGYHVLLKGRLPGGGRKNPSLGIEVYDRRRFFTMTGDSLPGLGTIEERQTELDALYPILFPSQELVVVGVRGKAPPSSLSDSELLAKAQAAKNGGDFTTLWRGDWQGAGYPSQSEADQALASHLAFWTGGEILQMDRLFRASGLFRSKWDQVHYADGKTYGQVTSQKSSDPLGRTDLGNARRLVERHGQDLHFVFLWRRWLAWDGHSWKEDSSGEAQRRAKETAIAIGQAALALPDSHQRELLLAHARASESVPRLEAMLSLATSEPGIPLSPDRLDSDPFLLNVANGTLELRNGTLREPRREDLLSKTAPVAYQPEAEAPIWMAFLERVTGGSSELCGFLQRIAGYCLSGDMRARCFFILYGRGANGKSTFLSTLLGILGDYGQQGAAQTFIAMRGERVRNDLAALRGARLVVTVETEEGQRLATALVKQITGGDRLRARFLFAEEFDFQPQCKLF
ncbi:MAG: phage/plasmid primase, P4 family, partial [Coprothermobacterota bacterium]|nr:phage/plasmid primase, P4 family [Coprothermobacterota bacterium]